MGAGEIRLARIGDVLDWLERADVPLRRVAAVTGTTYENARQILSRFRREQQRTLTNQKSVARFPLRDGHLDTRSPSLSRQHQYDRRHSELQSIVRRTWAAYDFEWGIRRLREFRQYFGYFNHVRGARLLAEQRLQLSLFHVHLGRTASAQAHARSALSISEEIARSTNGNELEGVLSALGAIAHADLLARRPGAALRILNEMETLHRQHRIPMLPEFFRKRGVAHLQTLNADDEARRAFRAGADAPTDRQDPLEQKMASTRHLSLLNPNYDAAGALMREAQAHYGRDSLQRSMCVHWAVAAALATDSYPVRREAYELLEENVPVAQQFGHQATISFLLRSTEALAVPVRFRREWVRLVLYSNAFRDE